MAYQPYDRNPSGIVFFGTSASDQVFESNSNFTYNGSTLNVPNITVSNGGNIGSASDPDAIAIASNGAVTFSQGVSIAGNLTVNGTTTTVNSTVVSIEDPIIILGSGTPSTDDNKDRGVAFNYHNGSVAKTGFFGYDDSTGKFTFIPDATITSEVVSGSSGTIVANLEGNVTGNVTGNAGTATALQTARNFSVTGDALAAAQSFDGTANVVLSTTLQNVAITGKSEITSVDGSNDYLLIYSSSGTGLRKVNRSNFISGLGTMSSFTVAGDTGANQTISDGNTLAISGGAGLATVGSATDTLTVNLALSELSAVAVASGDSFLALDSDGTTHQRSTVSQLGSYLAGTNVTAGADGKLSVTDATIEGAIFTAANFVDSSRIDFTVTAGASVTADLIASSVTETYLAASVAGSGLVGGAGTPLHVVGVSGITVSADNISLASTTAGSGLSYSAGVLNVNVDNSGIEISSDILRIKDKGISEEKISRTVETITSSKTADKDVTLVNATGNVTVTLPENGGTIGVGRMMTVKRIDTNATTVTISRQTADTIDGATSVQLYHRYETMTFISDGADWYII
jgi:hypothetical protein